MGKFSLKVDLYECVLIPQIRHNLQEEAEAGEHQIFSVALHPFVVEHHVCPLEVLMGR
jgi:hypothetical protein